MNQETNLNLIDQPESTLPAQLSVSVIMTVYNEATSIAGVLATLKNQTLVPTEVVIVDGGSSDATLDIIQKWRDANSELTLQVISQPGANISQGRNRAIEAASNEIIAVTDAGVRLATDWLEKLVTPFASSSVEVVSGFFRGDPDPQSAFQIAMGCTVLPALADIDPQKFLPSSRSVAFRKTAWKKAGGYPEWLDYCEDLIFDLNLKKAGYTFHWQPQAVALFAPRRSLRAFYLQYYRYARGDGKANLFMKRHILRYFIYCIFLPLGIWISWRKPLAGLGLVGCGFGYVWKAYRRLFFDFPEFRQLSPAKKLAALCWIPVIRATGDIAKMIGYPVGLWWRWRNPTKRERP